MITRDDHDRFNRSSEPADSQDTSVTSDLLSATSNIRFCTKFMYNNPSGFRGISFPWPVRPPLRVPGGSRTSSAPAVARSLVQDDESPAPFPRVVRHLPAELMVPSDPVTTGRTDGDRRAPGSSPVPAAPARAPCEHALGKRDGVVVSRTSRAGGCSSRRGTLSSGPVTAMATPPRGLRAPLGDPPARGASDRLVTWGQRGHGQDTYNVKRWLPSYESGREQSPCTRSPAPPKRTQDTPRRDPLHCPRAPHPTPHPDRRAQDALVLTAGTALTAWGTVTLTQLGTSPPACEASGTLSYGPR